MIRRLFSDLRSWALIGIFCFANTALAISAWSGSRTAIILLAIFGVITVVLLQVSRTLLDSVLELSQDTIEQWKGESELAHELCDNYLQAISDLRFHDAQRAVVHYERLREAIAKRHPDLADELERAHPINLGYFL